MKTLPFGLKRFIISSTEVLIDNKIEQRLVTAKSREQAWAKFNEQYFGVLKPDPNNWIIQEVSI